MSGGDELRSVVLGRERADEGETRESGRGSRGRVASPGASRRGGERVGRQGGWWRGAAARARIGHAPILLSRTKTTEEGPVGWAGAGCCWAAQGGGPGKYPFLLLFSFLFF